MGNVTTNTKEQTHNLRIGSLILHQLYFSEGFSWSSSMRNEVDRSCVLKDSVLLLPYILLSQKIQIRLTYINSKHSISYHPWFPKVIFVSIDNDLLNTAGEALTCTDLTAYQVHVVIATQIEVQP